MKSKRDSSLHKLMAELEVEVRIPGLMDIRDLCDLVLPKHLNYIWDVTDFSSGIYSEHEKINLDNLEISGNSLSLKLTEVVKASLS